MFDTIKWSIWKNVFISLRFGTCLTGEPDVVYMWLAHRWCWHTCFTGVKKANETGVGHKWSFFNFATDNCEFTNVWTDVIF